ncbi:MAG: hypothetical protein LBQ15_11320 [Clostridium sp.]|nr:hypothetical protein [Clostridium sp.]
MAAGRAAAWAGDPGAAGRAGREIPARKAGQDEAGSGQSRRISGLRQGDKRVR